MRSKTLRPGQAARRGAYRCVDCGYELHSGDVSSLPPCPHSAEHPHEHNAWTRRGHALAWALAAGVVVLGAGALVHSLGTRRIVEEASRSAEEARELALRAARHGRRSARRGARHARRAAASWLG